MWSSCRQTNLGSLTTEESKHACLCCASVWPFSVVYVGTAVHHPPLDSKTHTATYH